MGQVGPETLLLTLIDPCNILLKRLNSKQHHPEQVSSIVSSELLRVRSVQIPSVEFDRHLQYSSKEAGLKTRSS